MNRKGQMPVRFLVAFVFALSIFFATVAGAGWTAMTGPQYSPNVAYDAVNENWIVVWYTIEAPAGVYGARVDASGTLLDRGGFQISEDGGAGVHPWVEVMGGQTIVVWRDFRSASDGIYGQFLDDGSLIGSNFVISEQPGDAQFDPVVTGNGTDYMVVWEDRRNAPAKASMYGQRIDTTGDPIGSEFMVSSEYYAVSDIASNGSGWAVGWRGGQFHAYDSSGNPAGGVADAIHPGDGYADIASDGSGYLVIATYGSGSYSYVYGRLINADGSYPGTVLTLASDDESLVYHVAQPRIEHGVDRYLVLYDDGYNGGVFGFTVTDEGVPSSPHYTYKPNAVDGLHGNHELAFDSTNSQFLVVFPQYDNGHDVYGHLVGADAVPIGSDFLITEECFGCLYEGVCLDNYDPHPTIPCRHCNAVTHEWDVDTTGSTCDDGLYCTVTDTCNGGDCIGTGSPCTEGWFCSEGSEQCFEDEQTPIDLIAFEAEAGESSVLLTWETATERDMAGFHLLRSRVDNGGYERVTSSLIPSEGDAFTGASYEFTDESVDEGTYYYKLEAIDLTGASEFFGPVEATVEAEPEFGCGMATSGTGTGLLVLLLLAAAGCLVRRRWRIPARPIVVGLFVLSILFVFSGTAQAGWLQSGGGVPGVTYDVANGNWVTVWHRYFGYPDYRPMATRIADPNLILDPGGTEVYGDGNTNSFPQIAAGPNRDLVIWVDDNQILYGRMLENGSPIGEKFQVSTIELASDLPFDVAWGDGAFLVVYGHAASDTRSIWGRIVDEDGNLIGSTIEINSIPGVEPGAWPHPAVASNGSNWMVTYPTTSCIARRTVSFDGTVSAAACVSADENIAYGSVAAIGGNYVVAINQTGWDDERGWRPLYQSQLLDGDGNKIGSINSLIVGGFDWYTDLWIHLSCGTDRCFFTVAQQYDGVGDNILGVFVDANGVAVGSPFEVDSSSSSHGAPDSAFDPATDHVLVTWGNVAGAWGAVYESPGTEIATTFPISADCNGCFVDGVCYDEGTTCDDGLYCTATDTCNGGDCIGTGSPCTEGWFCSELSNQCFADEETPIDLITFEADAEDTTVLLTWETATERDMAGFHLLRSRVDNGGYERVTSSLIPSEGDAFTGASYEFTDESVDEGTYYYKLEAVDLTGASEFFGPVDVTVEAEPEFGCGMADSGTGTGLLVLLLLAAAGYLVRRRWRIPAQPIVVGLFVLSILFVFSGTAQAGWVQSGGEMPHVAFDAANNNWVTVWHRDFGSSDYRPMATRIADPDLILDPGGVEVFGNGSTNIEPRAASGPNGTLIIWEASQTLFGKILDDGTPTGDEFRISEEESLGDHFYAAWGSDAFLVVFWNDSGILGQIVDADGNPVGPTITIETTTSSQSAMRPVVASNGTEWIVVYESRSRIYSDGCIRRRAVSFGGSVSGDDTCLTPNGNYYRPSIAAVGSDYVVAYHWAYFDVNGGLGWRPMYFAQALDSDGDPQGSAHLVWAGDYDWSTLIPPHIACGAASCFVTITQEVTGPHNIVGRFTDLTGLPIGDLIEIAPYTAYFRSHTYSAYDLRTDHVLAVWSESDGSSNWDVYGAVYESPGIEITPTFPISADCDGCFVDGVCYDEAAACDDGLYCTATDTCTSGVCSGADSPCPEGWFCSELSNQCFADEETPIDLITFEADAEDTTVLLTWETATERDMAGFHLLRSRVDNGGYERVTSSLIPSEGDAFTGASYEFTDESVDEGTYYYKLEAIDLTGASEFFGPVEATVEAEPEFGCGMADSRMNAVMLVVMAAIGMLIWSRRRYPQT